MTFFPYPLFGLFSLFLYTACVQCKNVEMYIGPAELGQQGVVCLFVSRVRLMECLFPDGRVCICSVPHGRDLPLQTPLRGLGLGGEKGGCISNPKYIILIQIKGGGKRISPFTSNFYQLLPQLFKPTADPDMYLQFMYMRKAYEI